MKTIALAVAGLLFAAGAARADTGFSVSGNLVVAGTATITGTADYSLTTSSGIKILAGGITWPDGTATTSGQPYAWAGINYEVWSASGGVTAYSTGTTSFHVAAATMVFRGAGYATADTYFAIPKSSYSIVFWNPSQGFRQFGLPDLQIASIAKVSTVSITDDIAVAIAASNASGSVSIYSSAWRVPEPGVFVARGLRYNATLTSNSVVPFYSCSSDYWLSCDVKSLEMAPQDQSGLGYGVTLSFGANESMAIAAILNNASGSSASVLCQQVGDTAHWVSVNGGSATTVPVTPSTVNISLPTGFSSFVEYTTQTGGSGVSPEAFRCTFPAGVTVVRGGYW